MPQNRPRRPKVLCLDDEPAVVEGITRTLRKLYDVTGCTKGTEALAVLEADPGFAVVLSDMRMPEMNGAEFLAKARELAPDATRMLLTGQTDLDAAIAAINEGQIFRFLTKPCPPPTLRGAMAAAVAQHRLVTGERVLLQKTLRGSVEVMMEVLGLVSPTYFGRTTRLRHLAADLATALGHPAVWQIEVAAMLSQLGYVVLAPEIAEKVYYGRILDQRERAEVERAWVQAAEMLAPIPRLEPILWIVRNVRRTAADMAHQPGASPDLVRAARILRVAMDFDELLADGRTSAQLAIDTLRGREGHYDEDVLDALEALRGGGQRSRVAEVPVGALAPGMILVEDLALASGMLLVARGYEVTERLLARISGYPADALATDTVRVVLPREQAEAA
ncbi:MAG: response regulator [Deltaproteobacteria bacterium]|nr:MAG: response regulator [Deltaproteobacteria bacterium]